MKTIKCKRRAHFFKLQRWLFPIKQQKGGMNTTTKSGSLTCLNLDRPPDLFQEFYILLDVSQTQHCIYLVTNNYPRSSSFFQTFFKTLLFSLSRTPDNRACWRIVLIIRMNWIFQVICVPHLYLKKTLPVHDFGTEIIQGRKLFRDRNYLGTEMIPI